MTSEELLHTIVTKTEAEKKANITQLEELKDKLDTKFELIKSIPYDKLFELLVYIKTNRSMELPVEFTSNYGVYIENNNFRISVRSIYNQDAFEIVITSMTNIGNYLLINSNKPEEIRTIHREGYVESKISQLRSFNKLADEFIEHYSELDELAVSVIQKAMA